MGTIQKEVFYQLLERNWDVREIEYYLEHFDIDWIVETFNIEIKNPDSINFLDAYKALRVKIRSSINSHHIESRTGHPPLYGIIAQILQKVKGLFERKGWLFNMSYTRYKVRLWNWDGESFSTEVEIFENYEDAEREFASTNVTTALPYIQLVKERIASECVIEDTTIKEKRK